MKFHWRGAGEQTGWATYRLFMAVAVLTDSAIAYAEKPPAEPGQRYPALWDEMVKGREDELAWLGRPVGPLVRPARQTEPLLAVSDAAELGAMLENQGQGELRVTPKDGSVRVEPSEMTGTGMRFGLGPIPCPGPDLLCLMTVRGAPMRGYPQECARAMYAAAPSSAVRLGEMNRFMSHLNADPFEAGFYYRTVPHAPVRLSVEIEGIEPAWLSGLEVYAEPDAMCREFENGVVLVNPALHSYTFDLAELFPHLELRRLRGTPAQDAETNDGSPVGATVELAAKDGLFLAKQ
jgi:hypothetical protein